MEMQMKAAFYIKFTINPMLLIRVIIIEYQ